MTTSTLLFDDLFVGSAVVVDDRINDENSGMPAIVKQLEASQMPVLRRTSLPEDGEVRHWEKCSLIILDWEIFPVPDEDAEVLIGVNLGTTLNEQNAIRVARFVETLLTDLYCPIFIFSSQSEDLIWAELVERLEKPKVELETRILVRAKGEVESGLREALSLWVTSHPAMYALRSWDRGYERAKAAFFRELQSSSPQWPGIIWATSEVDSVNPDFELAETITRNILHRFEPMKFDREVFSGSGTDDGQEALRRVLHRQAVVPRSQLHENVLLPGDLFWEGEKATPGRIRINITPACDLVGRGGDVDDIQLVVLVAELVSKSELQESSHELASGETITQKGWEDVRDSSQLSHLQILYLLTDSGRPYRVRFKNWERTTWGEIKSSWRGRLMEPYTTQLQQKFALFFQRQGLPRLPEEFYFRPESP